MSQIFENTEWTDFLWDDHQKFEESARKAVRKGIEEFADKFNDFGDEAYYRFYSDDPVRKEEPAEGAQWAEKLHKCLEETGEFQNLKEYCKGSDWKSGISTSIMIDEILKQVDKPEEPFEDLEPDQEIVDMLKDLVEDPEISEEDREKLGAELNMAEEALNERAEQQSQAAKMLDETQVRNAARSAMAQAKSDITDVENAMDGLGCGQGAHSGARGTSKEARKLQTMLRSNPELKRVLEMAGRLKRLAARKQKAKPKLGTDEYTGVYSGDDLARMLPSEAMLLMDPDLEAVFARKLQEKQILDYELKEKPDEKQGPIIMLLDCSSSMRGNRMVWANAVALAFLSVATEQRRAFQLVHFNSDISKVFDLDTTKRLSVDDLLSVACALGASGGTNFEKPLAHALGTLAGAYPLNKADVVMVTDGEDDRISSEFVDTWVDAKDEAEASCYSVLIGRAGSSGERALKKFSDEVVSLADVMDTKEEMKMHELFGKV